MLFVICYSIDNSEASIFQWNIQKSKRIYENASDFQRQFLFLPHPLLVHATNIRDIAMMVHTSRFPNEMVTNDNLIAIIDQIHAQMHKLNRWKLGKIDEIRFLRPGTMVNRTNLNVHFVPFVHSYMLSLLIDNPEIG